MLLLHHIITRLALLNLVTRQSRKLLQRYNSISGKSKSIRPGGQAAHVCRRNENVRGCDVIRLSLSVGNYILRAAYKQFTPTADTWYRCDIGVDALIRSNRRWNRSGDPRIARNDLGGADFSSFDFKIPLLYRNGDIVRELISCGGVTCGDDLPFSVHSGIGEKRQKVIQQMHSNAGFRCSRTN